MAAVAFVLDVFSLAAIIAAFIWQVRNLREIDSPPAVKDVRGQALHPLSVVLLLEDPEVDAEPSVASVLRQDYPEMELVVVDDRPGVSGRDRSKRLAPDPRMRVVNCPASSAGWERRTQAFFFGYKATRNPWVLFLDDSVVLRRDALRRIMGAAWWRQSDFATIIPRLTSTGRWERIFMPFVAQLALLVFPGRALKISKPASVPSYGPVMLFRRTTYKAVGGHPGVRGEPLDDVALVRSLLHRGYKPLFIRGSDLAVVQTTASFPRMWQAALKGFDAALSGSFVRALAGAMVILLVFALPWALLVPALLLLSSPVSASPWMGAIIGGIAHIAMSFTYRALLKESLGIDMSLAVLQPIAALTAAAILVASHVGSSES